MNKYYVLPEFHLFFKNDILKVIIFIINDYKRQ